MVKLQTIVIIGPLFVLTTALPAPNDIGTLHRLHRRCGAVGQYFPPTTDQPNTIGPSKDQWQKVGVDNWLNTWVTSHSLDISNNQFGFAGAFGRWAIGEPSWSCRDDGSSNSCNTDVCDNAVLNNRGNDIQPAYYVLQSVSSLHSFFTGLGQAFEVSAIAAALSKDNWALTFYKDKDVDAGVALKELLNGVATVIGIGAAFAGLAGPVAGAVGGALAAAAGGASGAAGPFIGQHQDDTFKKSADLGATLANIVVNSMKSFTSANNILVHGDQYQGSDIRAYLSGGAFVDHSGVDKNSVIDLMNNFLIAKAINQLWRTQKIFIMGGGNCGDGQGIGSGPQSYSICRDGKAWYLYMWRENGGIILNSHKWGNVDFPLGADKLGQDGDYKGVTVADVINSSLDSYNVAGYNYNAETANSRVQSALHDGWRNPGAQGISWEGTFTIPVCDVGGAVSSDYPGKEYILQDYGKESRPVWCGPICSGDVQRTKDWIHAANMDGFQSPKHFCDHDHTVFK